MPAVVKPSNPFGLPNWTQPSSQPGVGELDLMGSLAVPAMAAEEGGGLIGRVMQFLKTRRGEVPSSIPTPTGPMNAPTPTAPTLSPIQSPWDTKPLTIPGITPVSREGLSKTVSQSPGLAQTEPYQAAMKQYGMKVQSGEPGLSTTAKINALPMPPSASGSDAGAVEDAARAGAGNKTPRMAISQRPRTGDLRAARSTLQPDDVRAIRAWATGEGATLSKTQQAQHVAEKWGVNVSTARGVISGDSFSSVK